MKSTFNLFHGTIQYNWQQIRLTNMFNFKMRDNHWLGNGVYFFVNDYEQAKLWSSFTARNTRDKNPSAVQQVVLYLEYVIANEDLLDLDTAKGRRLLDEFLTSLKNENIKIISEKDLGIHERVCLVLDFYVRYTNTIASKYTFTNIKDHRDSLKTMDLNSHGQQFCFYNIDTIEVKNLKEYEED